MLMHEKTCVIPLITHFAIMCFANLLCRHQCFTNTSCFFQNGYVYVTPKLEYQPTFGVEQETISEIARNWISVYVRPTCSLLRGIECFFASIHFCCLLITFKNSLDPDQD